MSGEWRGACVALCALAAFVAAGLAMATAAAPADPRRSGFEQMSPALQAMQRDDAQHPGLLWVDEGRALWRRVDAAGRGCAGCHGAGPGADVAGRHPAWDAAAGRPLSLGAKIERCRGRLGLPPEGADGAERLALSALFAHAARGRPVAPPDDPRLAPWRERGAALWRQRLGQLDLACVQCHDERAGGRLGGATIPEGHPTGYPIYRLEWQALGSLERRLRGCVSGVRAEPFPAGDDAWTAIELHLMQRAAGMALEGVGVRP